MEEYRVIRSARKTLSLEITEDLTVLVRAPYQVSQSRIEAFVAGQQDWITAHRERCRQWQEQHPEPTEEERLDCIARAKEILPQKVEYYGRLMGLMPTGLTITDARKRFGSCSGKNRISCAARKKPSTMWWFTSWRISGTRTTAQPFTSLSPRCCRTTRNASNC